MARPSKPILPPSKPPPSRPSHPTASASTSRLSSVPSPRPRRASVSVSTRGIDTQTPSANITTTDPLCPALQTWLEAITSDELAIPVPVNTTNTTGSAIRSHRRSSTRCRTRKTKVPALRPSSLSTPPSTCISKQAEDMFSQLSAALKTEVRVMFENDGVVDMVGGLNTGSSYSLPGQVVISMPALPSGYEGKLRELRELKLVFESKSEYFDDQVYTTSIDLATTEKPLLIPSSDPLRSHSRSIELAVSFDLRLPGWLPSTRLTDLHHTDHGVVVHSAAGWTESATLAYDPPSIAHRAVQTRSVKRTTSLLSQLSSITEKHTSRYFAINIRRHRLPSAINDRLQDGTERHYSLTPAADSTSPIECIVSVPDWVDVNGGEKDLKVSIRVRARRGAVEKAIREAKAAAAQPSTPSLLPTAGTAGDSLAPALSGNETPLTPQPLEQPDAPSSVPMERDTSGEILTHILELGMEVDEVETYSSEPSAGFRSLFPIPDEQPSRMSSDHALISPPHPRAAQALSMPFSAESKPHIVARRRKCLLADDGSQRNFVFNDDGLSMSERWRKVNIVLPMPYPTKKASATCRPTGEYDSPMLKVKHSLVIRVVCRNVGNEGEDIIVVLTTPIRFATSPKTMPGRNATTPKLPAYIQLFHENGEIRECDPLPLYSSVQSFGFPPSYALLESSVPAGDVVSTPSSSRSSSPHLPSLADAMDIDSPASSDDGHSDVSTTTASSSSSLPLPIPLPAFPTAQRPKLYTRPAIAATA